MLNELLERYWNASHAEGKEGRDHDTEDGVAQQTLSAIQAEVRRLILAEREACAKVCEAKARTLGERADLCDDDEDAIELKARAWQMAVLAAELRERSNAEVTSRPVSGD